MHFCVRVRRRALLRNQFFGFSSSPHDIFNCWNRYCALWRYKQRCQVYTQNQCCNKSNNKASWVKVNPVCKMGFRRNGKIFSESIVLRTSCCKIVNPPTNRTIPFRTIYPANIFHKKESQGESIYSSSSFTRKISYFFSASNLQRENLMKVLLKKYLKIYQKILDDIFYVYIFCSTPLWCTELFFTKELF